MLFVVFLEISTKMRQNEIMSSWKQPVLSQAVLRDSIIRLDSKEESPLRYVRETYVLAASTDLSHC